MSIFSYSKDVDWDTIIDYWKMGWLAIVCIPLLPLLIIGWVAYKILPKELS